MKPKAFRLVDFLVMAGPGLVALAFAILLLSKPVGTEAKALTFTVAVSFLAIYALFVYFRKRMLDAYKHTPYSNIFVRVLGDFHTDEDGLRAEILRTISLYRARLSIDNPLKYLTQTPVWVTFQMGPIQHPTNRELKLAGYTVVGGQACVVAYKTPTTTMERTAFAHELGHVILGRWISEQERKGLSAWNEDEHHRIMNKFGLP